MSKYLTSKKIAFLILLAILTLSCSADEELNKLEDNVSEASLTGTWKANDIYLLNGKIETALLGVPTTLNLDLEGKEYNATISLEQNPNTITSSGDITVKATISKVGFSVSEEYQENVGMNGQWTLADNVLKVTDNGITQEFEIVEFSGNAITFKQAFDEEFNNISGYSGVAKGSLYIGFVKQ